MVGVRNSFSCRQKSREKKRKKFLGRERIECRYGQQKCPRTSLWMCVLSRYAFRIYYLARPFLFKLWFSLFQNLEITGHLHNRSRAGRNELCGISHTHICTYAHTYVRNTWFYVEQNTLWHRFLLPLISKENQFSVWMLPILLQLVSSAAAFRIAWNTFFHTATLSLYCSI